MGPSAIRPRHHRRLLRVAVVAAALPDLAVAVAAVVAVPLAEVAVPRAAPRIQRARRLTISFEI